MVDERFEAEDHDQVPDKRKEDDFEAKAVLDQSNINQRLAGLSFKMKKANSSQPNQLLEIDETTEIKCKIAGEKPVLKTTAQEKEEPRICSYFSNEEDEQEQAWTKKRSEEPAFKQLQNFKYDDPKIKPLSPMEKLEAQARSFEKMQLGKTIKEVSQSREQLQKINFNFDAYRSNVTNLMHNRKSSSRIGR